jgi:2-oxoisovalerate dehydrogenase E1 component
MSTNRVAAVEAALDAFLAAARAPAALLDARAPLRAGSALSARAALELFEDQVHSRALDVAARELKRTGRSFYTISSAGHEQNALLGALLRTDDPCFLHYRSGALMVARARQAPGSTPLFDGLLSLCASAQDPISSGRHKVFGSRALWVPPQTSTIASHLPKAVGLATSLARARRLGLPTGLPESAIVCCSFGDASANHATALAGINLARYAQRRGSPTPILFVCEDNGIGISVDTPSGWIEDNFAHLPHLAYVRAAGDLVELHASVAHAIALCRAERRPVFLHLEAVRLWGHAGSDVETTYHKLEQIEAAEQRDPLLANARLLIECGAAEPRTLQRIVSDARERVQAAAEEAAARPRLETRAQVIEHMAPWDEARVRDAARVPLASEARALAFPGGLPEEARSPARRTLAALLNAALADELARRPELLVFGEDVGKKGGVYGLTSDLQKRFGRARVFDTLLDETSILGIAQGAAHLGLLPCPEIQYLAYLHNALDQLRGEACSLAYFSSGQFTNPMVVRIAGLAYQKGFGGHFHNDNSIGALRDIPGLMLAVPARGDDAARMLRGAFAAAKACARVVCFLEPIALYHERDLHEEGDGGWLCDYPPPDAAGGEALLPGELGVYGPADARVLIVSYANGLRLSLRAARRLEREHRLAARVLDLRWLAPLPHAELAQHARNFERVLVVDECRATAGGIADALIARLHEDGYAGRAASVRAADSYVPLGSATAAVLVGEDEIVDAARRLAR